MTPTTYVSENKMLEAVGKSLHKVAAEAAEPLIKQAVMDFECELRKKVGEVVIRLLNAYSIEKMGEELVIHVRIEKGGDE